MSSKTKVGSRKGNTGRSGLANSKLVCNNSSGCQKGTTLPKKTRKCVNSRPPTIKEQLRKRPNHSLPLLKRFFIKRKYPIMTQNLIMNSWKEGTRKSYSNYIKQWIMFCKYHNVDPHDPSVLYVTNFLRLLLEDGASYSTVNVARCALSSVLDTGTGITIGCDWSVSRVVKGCGNLKPPAPKYDITWDVSRVFHKLESWVETLTLHCYNCPKKSLCICCYVQLIEDRRFG